MPSVKAAAAAKRLGYTRTMVYREGFPVWTQKGYPVERSETGREIRLQYPADHP